ncbi:hypothetical protein Vafri_6290 [Volvox africanus]|uniref:Uncharacterized protein n=1 Tax=Volvox africanus TaxID=51714 RepID=A0A8J4AY90_9CHLO|nr:hypothetical protein Vafri_6290 [Volvox africanus]
MSRFFFPFDTDGDPGSLRLIPVAEQRTEQRAQPNVPRRGFITNVRPLTVAEVLPPHLRSGNSSRGVASFEFWPRPVKAKTPMTTDVHRLYSVRAEGLQTDRTPTYRPGRYAYNAVMEMEPADALPPQKPSYHKEYDYSIRDAIKNVDNELREVQTQTDHATSGAFYRDAQESTNNPSELKPVPVEVQVQYEPETLTRINTAAEGYVMLQGEAHGSSSTWRGSPSSGWQSDMGTSRHQPATALTSTLVARMDALRQQLLRVSSTLSGVQERAAHLASSMGHQSHTLYNGGGAGASTAAAALHGQSTVMSVRPDMSARPIPSAAAVAAGAPSPMATSDLPTQRYFPPIGPGDMDFPSGSGRSASTYDPRNGSISETRVYVVSVSAASDSPEPPPQHYLTQPPPAGLQHVSLSPSQPTRHQQLLPQRAAQAAVEQSETPLAAAAASAAVLASYPAMPTTSSLRPQRYSPAVAVHTGALEEPSYHPFELGSPAGRTMHVMVPERQAPAAERMVFSPYYYADMDNSKHEAPSGAEMRGSITTPQSVRKFDRLTGTYFEEVDSFAQVKGYSYPRINRGGSAVNGGGGVGGGESLDFGGLYGQSAAPAAAAATATAGDAGKREVGHTVPPTTRRPTPAAASTAGVAPSTMASAFVQQLGSPVLQELLTQSSPYKPHGPGEGSASRPKHKHSEQTPASAQPAQIHSRHQTDLAAVSDTTITTTTTTAAAAGTTTTTTTTNNNNNNSSCNTNSNSTINTAAAAATTAATTPLSLDSARYRRLSSDAQSNASSMDAERVYPWAGSRGNGRGSDGAQYDSPVGPSHFRSGGGGGGGLSGAGSVGSNDATRAFDSRRSSIGGLSDVSSLDAARVHPWIGGDNQNTATIRLRSADSSLELMAAAPLPHSSPYGSEAGEDVERSGERRRSISGRSVGGGSWLLLSPTVVVKEAAGGSGAAIRALDGEEGTTEGALEAGVEAPEVIEEPVPSNAETQQQDWQQDSDDAGIVRYGNLAEFYKRDSNQAEEEGQEPSVAVSPSSPPPRTSYDADGGVGSGSGSTTPTPTPRADLSFAFHSASFAMREGSGDEDADGKDWLHRVDLYHDDERNGGRRRDGDSDGAYGRPGALTALGSHRDGRDDDNDDELLQTPTHDNSWNGLKLRNPSGGTGDGTGASDADSDAGGASASAAAVSRRRWQIQRRGESVSSVGPGANDLYDGYSEEEEEDRDGTGKGNGARRRWREAMRLSESLPIGALSSTAAQRAAASDLYHSFSFPSTEAAVRAAEAEAAATAVSSSPLRAGILSNTGGSAASSTSGAAAGGMLGGPAMVGFRTDGGGGGAAASGTSETPDAAGCGGHAIHHRLARPSRILVPSSPRSSVGGWSVPSPVPSPHTHGVGGMRTPSPGRKATNFSLRSHLNLTVSSCLFAETSSSDEGDGCKYEYEYGGGVGIHQYAKSQLAADYEASSPLMQRQMRHHADVDESEGEDEVGKGEEVTSRPTSWLRDKAGEVGHRDEDEDEEGEEEEALEVEEEDIPLAGDDEDDATAAVAAWAYGDARRAAVEAAVAAAVARASANGGSAGGGGDGQAAVDD